MSMPSENHNTKIISRAKQWVEQYVIGLNLCPFAAVPFKKDLVHIELCVGDGLKEWVEIFIRCTNELISIPSSDRSTTLILIKNGLDDFDQFLDVLATFENMLSDSQLDEYIQLASFHPDYHFQNTKKSDITNYTNRAPWPIVQLLRTEEVEKAIKAYGDTDEIYLNNMERMKKEGKQKLESMLGTS